MYAHQVIEAIKNCSEDSKIYKNKNLFVRLIRDSQKFYFGDVNDVINLFDDKYNEIPMFSFELSESIRMPYSVCSFMFSSTVDSENIASKVLFTVIEENKGNNLFFNAWLYIEEEKDWSLWPVGISIKDILNKETISEMVVSPLKDSGLDFTGKTLKEMEKIPAFKFCKIAAKLVNFALMMLNCRNIETIDNRPPEKLNKKRAKKGKQPLFTYKTLVIKPTGKQQKSVPKHLWDNRIHLCRGHFKTYTEDAPLFGKYTGRYWWQPSVKGRNKKGVVIKDYEIQTN